VAHVRPRMSRLHPWPRQLNKDKSHKWQTRLLFMLDAGMTECVQHIVYRGPRPCGKLGEETTDIANVPSKHRC